MQAGEMIGFIEPVNVLNERYDDNRQDRERAKDRFEGLCLNLLDKFSDNLSEYETTEEVGILTVQESPLCITARDGSSLHILPFSHHDEVGYIKLGIAVIEHNAQGEMIDGHVYAYDADQFIRTPIQYDSAGNVPDEKTGRFSVVAMYRNRDELDLLRIISSEKAQETARQAYEQLQPDATTELWEEALGRVPTEEEVAALAGILVLAKPYAPVA